VAFPVGNIAPEGSVIKATAIDPSVVDDDGVYRHTGGRGCLSRKSRRSRPSSGEIKQGDIMVVIGGGPSGTGMEETYQLTSALKHISWGKTVSLITDARFSGVSTGACFGHVAPEALAGGPIGKLRDNDVIEIGRSPDLNGQRELYRHATKAADAGRGRRSWRQRDAPELHAHDFCRTIPACGRRYSR
jgi:dihydroxyacid dehydratase/phosphogluconate dehydratase